jgi:predicted lysophospholipase L1 biosynthesis ABC-type transport system permease subunit
VPLLVVDRDVVGVALEAADRDPLTVFDREVWAPGSSRAVLGALTESGYAYDLEEVRRAEDFSARPELAAQQWSLAYLRAVALAAGLLGLLGVALHALAQQRRRTVAALLMARMGLSRSAADRSATLEIGLLALLGALVAVGTALPASALVIRLFDPDPDLLPAPLFAVPWTTVRWVLAGTVVATCLAGLLVARSARRARAGEVLRDAE